MAVQGYTRRFWFSSLAETAFGTAQSIVGSINLKDGPPIRPNPKRISDVDMANGLEFGRKDYYGDNLWDATVGTWASPLSVLWSSAFAMGTHTHGDVAGGGTGDKLHTITMSAAGVDLPSTTIEDHLKGVTPVAATDLKHRGVCVEGFDLSWGNTGFVDHSIVLSGSGLSAAADVSTEPTTISQCYFTAEKTFVHMKSCATELTSEWLTGGGWAAPVAASGHMDFTTAPNGSFVSIGSMIKSAKLSYRNGLANHIKAGSATTAGIYGGRPDPLKRTVTFEMELEQDAVTDDYIWALNSGTAANNIDYTILVEMSSDTITVASGSYYSAFFAIPLAALTKVPDGKFSPRAPNTDKYVFEGKSGIGTATAMPLYAYVADLLDIDFAG